MKVLILYRPNSEHGRVVETFARDFKYKYGNKNLDLLTVDSRDGLATASLYDVVQYPAILALADDGSVQRIWQGEALPLMDEVAYYTL